MKLLLTGGAGYVGSACLRWLVRHGHDPIAYDNLTGKSDIEQFDANNGMRYVVWTVDLETPPPAVLGPPAYDTPNFKIWKLF